MTTPTLDRADDVRDALPSIDRVAGNDRPGRTRHEVLAAVRVADGPTRTQEIS